MIAAVRYSAAAAGARAGLSQRLDTDDRHRLRSATSLEDVVTALYNTTYASVLPDDVSSTGQLERALAKHVSVLTYMPLPFFDGASASVYEGLWRFREIEDLFAVLRGVHERATARRIRASLHPLGEPSTIDWRSLCSARSVDDVIGQLKADPSSTSYARSLSQAYGWYERSGNVAVLEIALGRDHQRRLRDAIESLHGPDRQAAVDLVGILIDARLALSILRYRTFYGMGPHEIMGYSLDRGLTIGRDHVKRLASGEAPLSVLRNRWPFLNGADLEGGTPRRFMVDLELQVRRHRHQAAVAATAGYPFGLGLLLAFAVLLEDEVHDIMAIVEGTMENWSWDATRGQLIEEEAW